MAKINKKIIKYIAIGIASNFYSNKCINIDKCISMYFNIKKLVFIYGCFFYFINK